ncbi:MAG: hypothetical protein HYX74_00190 [Acidobacteria bacterium]|nr:hypothetical protein [Acidobacteriota bacterium]
MRSKYTGWAAPRTLLLLFVLGAASCQSGHSAQMDYGINQVPYSRGQNVVPVFEGWERNPDGTFNMVFGYLNRNYEEELDIPIGPDNNIEPGGPDQGQPTFFGSRRHRFQFRVKVPGNWGATQRLVWTLTIRGRTEKANAFLLPEWEIDDQVIAGGLAGGGGAPDLEHEAPAITVGPDQTITLPDTATLTASVSDDGLPMPRPPRSGATATAAGAAAGSLLRVEWVVWRRPSGAAVTFNPALSPVTGGKGAGTGKRKSAGDGKATATAKPEPVIGGKAVTTAGFSAPGKYVLKGFAFDGGLMTPSADVTVTVNPAP